jgi:hypothetical protein
MEFSPFAISCLLLPFAMNGNEFLDLALFNIMTQLFLQKSEK